MNTKSRMIVFIFLAASVSAWAQPSAISPTISEIATAYTNYSRITEHAVFVNPELAVQCAPVSKPQIAAAEAKFGPHANSAMLIYMNPLAADAFGTNATFPVGSVVVKQKTIPGHDTNNGVGGMVKRPAGYDPAHGDWKYFYFESPKKIESGRIASCVQCHDSAKEKDHVFGTWRAATK